VAQHKKGVMPATAMGLSKAETCKSQASKDDVSDGPSPALHLQLQLQLQTATGRSPHGGMEAIWDAMITMQAHVWEHNTSV
jgi:hypothetical protein